MIHEKSHNDANKKIAKNTLILYIRMLFSVAVSLFTVRIVWRELGVDDYGIYNVVAGIVLMFQFLNSAMVGSTQRFLAYAIGKKDSSEIKQTFSSSIKAHYTLAIIIFILSETLGLWLLCTTINIPADRIFASHIVYQASVISFVYMVICVPYNAAIVAYEDIRIFGIYGILEVILKLVVALSLIFVSSDRLIIYSALLLVVSIIMRQLYIHYCKTHYPNCIYDKTVRSQQAKELFSFAGWTMLGSLGVSGREQGLNIILNVFYNVAYNAAKGIANQVNGVITGFTYNFQMSMFPQITKRYATGEIPSMLRLVFAGCQMSYFMLLIIIVPLFFRSEYVLTLWLGEDITPEMVGFLNLMLIASLVDCVKGPIIAALQATGNIRNFQISVFVILMLALPMAWLWLKINRDPYSIIYVAIISNFFAVLVRLYLLKCQIGFHSQSHELISSAIRIVVSSAIYFAMAHYINSFFKSSFIGLILYCIAVTFIGLIITYSIGLTASLRKHLLSIITAKFQHKKILTDL